MDKISDLIEAAGARAEAVPAFLRELLLALEARVEAVESGVSALSGLNAPRPASTSSDAAKLAKAKAALAEAEKAIADEAQS